MFLLFGLLFLGQGNAQSLLPLDTTIRGIVNKGASFSYYTDIPPATSDSVRYVYIFIQRIADIGFYQVHLKQGSGAIFDETRPTGNAWSSYLEISSERTTGDISGRWYITVSSCSSCTNVTTTSTYEITATVHDFLNERQIIIGSSTPQTIAMTGDSWGLAYFNVLDLTPSVYTITVSKTSSVGFGQIYLGRDYIPTTSSYTYTAPYGSSNNFYISNTQLSIQVPRVGVSNIGRWYVGMIGCQTCTNTEGYTRAIFDVSVISQPWNNHFDLSTGTKIGTLAFDQWDFYYIDLPGDYQHLVTITLQNTTELSYFKVYTRKTDFPTSSTYTSMVPSSTTYSGNITVNIIPQSVDLGGRWYIGVRFCRACNSQNQPFLGSYQLHAVLSSKNENVTDSFEKILSAESLEIPDTLKQYETVERKEPVFF